MSEINDMKQMREYHEYMIKKIDQIIAEKEAYLKDTTGR